MHFRYNVDPIPLKATKEMEYGRYADVPEYYGHPGAPPVAYTSYGRPPIGVPMRPVEPIVPHENDILMGRGGKNNQHTGNEKLRKLARLDAKAYSTSSKKIKSNIARGLVTKVRQMQPAGRFLKRNPVTSEWEDVGNEYAREKASQVLRDAVALLQESGEEALLRGIKQDDEETEDAPELVSAEIQPPAAKRPRLMRATPPPTGYYAGSYGAAAAPQAWQFQAPLTPTLAPPTLTRLPTFTPPTLKRLRSANGSWFERAAFFTAPNTPTTPTIANLNGSSAFTRASDTSRALLLGGGAFAFPPSPSISRRGSLCPSVGSLPGENYLLHSNASLAATQQAPNPLLDVTVSTAPATLSPPPTETSSDEFYSDFF